MIKLDNSKYKPGTTMTNVEFYLDNGVYIGKYKMDATNTKLDDVIFLANHKFGKDCWSHFRIHNED